MSKRSQRKKRQEDIRLAPEQFSELNGYFYETEPYQYFRHRLRQLLLFVGKPDVVEELLRDGVEYGRIQLAETGQETKLSEEKEKNAVLDSEILLHHMGETLLRMYLAHAELAPCPWLELSRLRSFTEFKELVRGRFRESDPEENLSEIRDVFMPLPREVLVEAPDEAWEFGPRNIESFLRHFAGEILDGAHLYNAGKHGLAVRSGDSAFSLGDSESPILKASGPALTFLEVVERDEGKLWARSVEWVDVAQNIALVETGCQLMDCLWQIAKWRYLKQPPIAVRLFETPRYQDVVAGPSVKVEKMSMDLAYYKVEAASEFAPREIQIASRFRTTKPMDLGSESDEKH